MIPLFKRRDARREDSVYKKGLRGEKTAERILKKEGMRLLERRWRAAGGEADLIMRDGDTVVFVEVKYRPEGRQGDGAAAVTDDKMRRLSRCADAYMARFPDLFARIDILEITSDGPRHLKDVR
ncbi:MAG: YraN family protein [Clostridia bacterium]|nr:YraN family protein [Clostridia bacterium]